MRSAIILAGGKSTRMGEDKGLKKLDNSAIVLHVIKRISHLVNEVLLVLGSEEQKEAYSQHISDAVRFVVDEYGEVASLVGALSGFKYAKGEYALLTGCDMPFISPEAVSYLFNVAENHNGATFQWENGWIEPLLAVYRVKPAYMMAEKLYSDGEYRLRMILKQLDDVKMIPMNDLRKIDRGILSFFDADTEELYEKAEELIKNGIV